MKKRWRKMKKKSGGVNMGRADKRVGKKEEKSREDK